MTIGTSPIGTAPIAAEPGHLVAATGALGDVTFSVTMAFTVDAQLQAANDATVFQANVGFNCDAVVLVGTGGATTQPTKWTSDSSITTTWIPDNPISGV